MKRQRRADAARATWNTSLVMADPAQSGWQRQQWAAAEKAALEEAGIVPFEDEVFDGH